MKKNKNGKRNHQDLGFFNKNVIIDTFTYKRPAYMTNPILEQNIRR